MMLLEVDAHFFKSSIPANISKC